MRSWAFTFFILSILAALIGFTHLAPLLAQFSQNIFYIFGVLFLAALGFYLYQKKTAALSYSLIFLAITLVAWVLAFITLTMAMVDIAKICFYIFFILFVIAFTIHLLRNRT